MACMWEHIYCSYFLKFIPISAKVFQISCQCCRIAAYVYDSLWHHVDHCFKYALFTTFTWWIYDDYVGSCIFTWMSLRIIFIILWKYFFCFSYKEFCIFKSIDICIFLRIFNSLRYDFYSVYFLCFLGKEERNCSDSAVYVPYCFISSKSCIF